jgi:hypothetical protein
MDIQMFLTIVVGADTWSCGQKVGGQTDSDVGAVCLLTQGAGVRYNRAVCINL